MSARDDNEKAFVLAEAADFRRMEATEDLLGGTNYGVTPWLVVHRELGVVGGAPSEQEARFLVEDIRRVCWIIDADGSAEKVKP